MANNITTTQADSNIASRQNLYKAVTDGGYNVGTFDQFSNSLNNPDAARQLYDAIESDPEVNYDLSAGYDAFASSMGVQQAQPQDTTAPTATEPPAETGENDTAPQQTTAADNGYTVSIGERQSTKNGAVATTELNEKELQDLNKPSTRPVGSGYVVDAKGKVSNPGVERHTAFVAKSGVKPLLKSEQYDKILSKRPSTSSETPNAELYFNSVADARDLTDEQLKEQHDNLAAQYAAAPEAQKDTIAMRAMGIEGELAARGTGGHAQIKREWQLSEAMQDEGLKNAYDKWRSGEYTGSGMDDIANEFYAVLRSNNAKANADNAALDKGMQFGGMNAQIAKGYMQRANELTANDYDAVMQTAIGNLRADKEKSKRLDGYIMALSQKNGMTFEDAQNYVYSKVAERILGEQKARQMGELDKAGTFGFVVSGLGDSILGSIMEGTSRTMAEAQGLTKAADKRIGNISDAENAAIQQYAETKAGFLANLARGAMPMLIDMPMFISPVGKGASAIVGAGVKAAASKAVKGVADAAAKNYYKGVFGRYVGLSLPGKIVLGATQGALTGAMFGATSTLAQQYRLGDYDMVDVFTSMPKEALSWGVMGAGGVITGNLAATAKSAVARNAAKAAGVGIDGTVMAAPDMWEKYKEKGVLTAPDVASALGNGLATAVLFKVEPWAKEALERRRLSAKGLAPINMTFTETDHGNLSQYELLHNLSKGLETDAALWAEPTSRAVAADGTVAERTVRKTRLYDEYQRMMLDKDVPYETKAKVNYMMNGQAMAEPTVIAVNTRYNDNGTIDVYARTADGGRLQGVTAKTEAEAKKAVDGIVDVAVPNLVAVCETINNTKITNDAVRRGIASYVADNGHMDVATAERIYSAISGKLNRGEALTDAEKRFSVVLRPYINAEQRAQERFVGNTELAKQAARRAGIKESEIPDIADKPYSRMSDKEKAFTDEYIRLQMERNGIGKNAETRTDGLIGGTEPPVAEDVTGQPTKGETEKSDDMDASGQTGTHVYERLDDAERNRVFDNLTGEDAEGGVPLNPGEAERAILLYETDPAYWERALSEHPNTDEWTSSAVAVASLVQKMRAAGQPEAEPNQIADGNKMVNTGAEANTDNAPVVAEASSITEAESAPMLTTGTHPVGQAVAETGSPTDGNAETETVLPAAADTQAEPQPTEPKAENGSDAEAEPTLLNVVKTLYEKGKTAASKLFNRSFFDVAKTPDFMKKLGLTGEKFTIRYGVISRHFGKDARHNLPLEVWEQLPDAIQKPFAITKYFVDDAKQQQKGYRLYTTLRLADGSYVVVSADVKNAGKELEVNAVNTVFGRDAISEVHDELIYTSKEITPEQQALLDGNNPHQYLAEQELSTDKDTPSVAKKQEDAAEKDIDEAKIGAALEALKDTSKAQGIRLAMKLSDKELAKAHEMAKDRRVLIQLEAVMESREEKRAADKTGQAVADAAKEVDVNPTEAQKEAGNYRKGHVRVDGMDISIEQPKGSVRRGTDADGKQWESEMHDTYGYIRGTVGVDGDHIDVFLSDHPDKGGIFVVDQVDPKTGKFDEHKVMYGYADEEEAKAAYLANYEKGWRGLGAITAVSREDFRKWVESSRRKTKPFSEYSMVKKAAGLQSEGVQKGTSSLTDEEVASITGSMKAHATIAPRVEINDENWKDTVETPIGTVKMGENQKTKLFVKGRENQYGMLLETLQNPDIVLEEEDAEQNTLHERPSSYLFVKTFEKEDGSKYIHFESVTVSQNGLEVSISSHIIRENQLKNKMKKDRLLFVATALDASANTSAEQPIVGGSHSSEGKGSEKISDEKEGKQTKYNGYLDGKTKLTASAIDRNLSKRINIGGAVKSIAEHIEGWHKDGGLKVEANEYMPEPNRRRWNRMSQDEQDAWEAAHSKPKTQYLAGYGKHMYELGKTAYDYAKWLLDSEAAAKQSAGEYSSVDKETVANAPAKEEAEAGRKPRLQKADADEIEATANEYGVDATWLSRYAEGMRERNSAAVMAMRDMKALYLREHIAEKKALMEHDGISGLRANKRLFEPIEKAIKAKYGDVDVLVEERRKQAEQEHNIMEAARKRAEEEERKREARLEELAGLTDEDVDKRYAEALEKGDEAAAREMLDEAARRKGYGDATSDYQGVGAWSAPSDPGFATAEERRADVEENGGDVNLDDIAHGYSPVQEDMYSHPERTGFGDEAGIEAGRAINNALNALREGKKDVKIKVYRAVPTSVKEGKLRNGDWVTPSRKYAETHGNSRLKGEYRIIEDEVPASELWFDGNDIREWGYDNGKSYRYKNAKNNRKLNDLVTRDDKGNVIPPSKRFNSRKADERYQKADSKAQADKRETALRDAVVERMRESGLDVITDDAEGQRVLDEVNGNAKLSAKKRRALETAELTPEREAYTTAVSSADGAKILNNIDSLASKYEKTSSPKTFIGDLAKALNIHDRGTSSKYATFETKSGKVVTFRISNHNAAVRNFDNENESEGISIVVSGTANKGIKNDGSAHIVEYYYNAIKLRRAEGKPLAEILRSIKQALYSGEFTDTTGLAERQEVNADDVVRYNKVYHGSAADFDSFDHSHMGEGEGASEFLSSLGFVGIKYPADFMRGGRADGKKNYVIFNEADARITDHVRFFRTADGEAYGFTVGGKIYIDPRVAKADTPIHEYSHLWSAAMREADPGEWANIVELMRGTGLWDEVKARYPELETDDDIADEVLAHYSGSRGAERLRAEQQRIIEGDGTVLETAAALSALERVRDALRRFWKGVADFLHIHFTTAEEVADRVLHDLLHGFDPRKYGKSTAEDAVSFSKVFGGNSGYVGYSMSKRAALARKEGKFPKTDFKRYYGVTDSHFKALLDAGILNDSEWHHTSMYGNETTFYRWDEPEYADVYDEHKEEIGRIVKDRNARLRKLKTELGYSKEIEKGLNPYEDDADKREERRAWERKRFDIQGSYYTAARPIVKECNDAVVGVFEKYAGPLIERRTFMEDYQKELNRLNNDYTRYRMERVNEALSSLLPFTASNGVIIKGLGELTREHGQMVGEKARKTALGEFDAAHGSDVAEAERNAPSIKDYMENEYRISPSNSSDGARKAAYDFMNSGDVALLRKNGDGKEKQEIEDVNRKFNEELQQQINGTLLSNHIYKLGKPGKVLLSTGVPDLPIQMNAKRLQDKATSFDHDFDLSEVKDLVKALQSPLAVFAYGNKTKAQNIIIPLQKGGKNFIVGLSLNPTVGGKSLEINSIRNVFPKDNSEWLNWINQGKTLYLDKEKIQILIDQQRTNLADVDYLDLDSVAKVIENFENPKSPEIQETAADEMQKIVEAAKADGSYMKAPNGEPTELEEHQWAQVRTKAFKNWFGDWENDPENASKVVDENGEPLVVFHYTGKHFTVFGKDKVVGENTFGNAGDASYAATTTIGHWFTTNGDLAADRGKPMRVFLNIRDAKDMQSLEGLAESIGSRISAEAAEAYEDDWEDNEGIKKAGRAFVEDAMADGHDGVVIEDEEFGGTSYVAFLPNQIKSATDNIGTFSTEQDNILLRSRKKGDGVSMRLGDPAETFAERQKAAIENRGVVTFGLVDMAKVNVVDIPRHQYEGSIAQATSQAVKAAKGKYVPNGKPRHLRYDNYGTAFDYIISSNAIDICLSPKHQGKSVNKGVHLALAEHLDEIINNSIEVEEHPDYVKVGGNRNETVNPDALMHRFYGVAVIDGVPCRVMTLMREDKRKGETNGIHSYEVQKIEVLDNKLPSTSNGVGTPSNKPTAYPLAKLLQGVEKAHDKGKKLLEESEKSSNRGRGQSTDGFAALPKAKRRAAVEREAAAVDAELGTHTVVADTAELSDAMRDAVERGGGCAYYDPATGETVVLADRALSAADVRASVVHENIGHKSLDELLGGKAGDFYREVAEHIATAEELDELRKDYPEADGARLGSEWMAHLSETEAWKKRPTLWRRFVSWLRMFMWRHFGTPLNRADADYALWKAARHAAKSDRGPLYVAEDAVRNGERTDAQRVKFRTGRAVMNASKVNAAAVYERRMRNAAVQTNEAFVDSMASLREAMLSIYRAKHGSKNLHIEDIPSEMNPYTAENLLSSRNHAQQEEFENAKFAPMLDEAVRLAPNKDARQDLTEYMLAKHGLERNALMRQREFDELSKKLDDANMAGDLELAEKIDKQIGKLRDKDYAGLTGLSGTKNARAAEDWARDLVDRYESTHDTANFWDAWKDCTNEVLKRQYESGLISKESYETMRDMYDNYVPLRGFRDETASDVWAYLMQSHGLGDFNPIKKAEGRVTVADDPFATLAQMADTSIASANRNDMKKRLLNFVMKNPSDLFTVRNFWIAENPLGEWEVQTPTLSPDMTAEEIDRAWAEFEERMQRLHEQDPDKFKRGTDAVNIPYIITDREGREHNVILKTGGRSKIITINGNPRAAQAINGLTNPDAETNAALKAAASVNRYLSVAYTTANPDFVLSNLARDTGFSFAMTAVKESPSYLAKYGKNWFRSFPFLYGMLTHNAGGGNDRLNGVNMQQMFNEFLRNGGETGYTKMNTIEQRKTEIGRTLSRKSRRGVATVKNAPMALKDFYINANRAMELASRFAAYLTSREVGRDETRSAYDAKEISGNFNKKGSGFKTLGLNGQTAIGNIAAAMSGAGRMLYVFFNPAVQGTFNNFFKYGFHRGKGNAVKMVGLLGSIFAWGFVQALLNSADDKDDGNGYYDLPDAVRRDNLIFKTGDGKWAKIPLCPEFRSVFGAGELAYSVMSRKQHMTDEELAYKVFGSATQILPIDPMESGALSFAPFDPSTIRPMVDAYVTNTNFAGIPIANITDYNATDPEWKRVYKSADEHIVSISKWLNEISGGDDFTKGAINFNPEKAEYLITSYTGGVGTTVLNVVKSGEMIFGGREFDANNVPVLRRFYASSNERTRNRAVNADYAKYKEQMKETEARVDGYRAKARNNVMAYAGLLNELNGSADYEKAYTMKYYDNLIQKIRRKERMFDEETEADKIKPYENMIADLKRQAVRDIQDIEDERRHGKPSVVSVKRLSDGRLAAIQKSIGDNLNDTYNQARGLYKKWETTQSEKDKTAAKDFIDKHMKEILLSREMRKALKAEEELPKEELRAAQEQVVTKLWRYQYARP